MTEKKQLPKIITSIPGPKTQSWIKRYYDVFGSHSDISIESAEGCTFQDVDGNRFLVLANSTDIAGYSNHKILGAAEKQLKKNISRAAGSPILIEFTEKLLGKVPKALRTGRVNFTSSGTETVELAISLARAYTGRPIIISYHDSHHGFIGTPYQVSGDPRIKSTWPAKISDIIHIPYPKCYRCPFKLHYSDCDLLCLDYLHNTLETVVLPDQIAALLFEPILVNGGMYVPPKKYMEGIVKLCRDNGILLIMDEVYTGIGKSGKFLTMEHWNITPEILCIGKAIGGGFPLSAVVTKREVTDETFGGVRFTGTFSGNLVACSTGLATLNYLEEKQLDVNAMEVGNYLMESLKDISEEKKRIGDIRGMGLLIGIDLVEDKDSKVADGSYATIIEKKALENGLIIRRVGRYRNVLALTPPLILNKTQVDEALAIFAKIID